MAIEEFPLLAVQMAGAEALFPAPAARLEEAARLTGLVSQRLLRILYEEEGLPLRQFLCPYVDLTRLVTPAAARSFTGRILLRDTKGLAGRVDACIAAALFQVAHAEGIPEKTLEEALCPKVSPFLYPAQAPWPAVPAFLQAGASSMQICGMDGAPFQGDGQEKCAVFLRLSWLPAFACAPSDAKRRALARDLLAFAEIGARAAETRGGKSLLAAGDSFLFITPFSALHAVVQNLQAQYVEKLAARLSVPVSEFPFFSSERD